MLLKPHWLSWAYTPDSETKETETPAQESKVIWEILAGQRHMAMVGCTWTAFTISEKPLRVQRSHRLNLYISKLGPTRSQLSTFLDHTQYTAAYL